MDASKIVRFLTETGSISMRVASQKMGRYPTFLASSRGRGKIPQVNTLASIADVYGYDLLLRNRADGEEIIIDPPAYGDE